ncbi:HAD family phosphatase [Pacificimonas sp. WHA3]|uniref:HAD family phosphatase n=1 Tax=Pacificimonas pallii TaxID=2827236 RepID=A0ABS6SIF0_9SPHN|nr:HAD family phosphatase [Pacificimonas pallii]MBV7257711.1 HAD family phosphatase [Pacificimonas pallii]
MPASNLRPIIFDFDGVLIESELAGNQQLAEALTELGTPTTTEQAIRAFMGLSGENFFRAVEGWIGGSIPDRFHDLRRAEDARVLGTGLDPVPGALAFLDALPSARPRAIASSSSTDWILRHLGHVARTGHFGGMIFSGKEHVERGKPAPDLYLHAAAALGADPADCFVIEDSPVGVTAARAAGTFVCGLAAGGHCLDGHDEDLRGAGADVIAFSYEDVAAHLATFDERD